jgi:hypothetical protein
VAGFVVALKRKLFACYCCDREEKVTRYWLNRFPKLTTQASKHPTLSRSLSWLWIRCLGRGANITFLDILVSDLLHLWKEVVSF